MAKEFDYREGTSFDYNAAGQRNRNYSVDQAENNFHDMANDYGVNSGPYGSWDQFWIGYYNLN